MKYTISDVAKEVSNRIDDPSNSKYERFVGLEHYDSGNPLIKRWGSTASVSSSMKAFRKGDILIARRNVYLRRAALVNFDGITSGDSIVLRANLPAFARILPFILNTDKFWNYASKNSDGTMSKRLSPKLLQAFEFELPDNLGNVKEISDILWSIQELKDEYLNLLQKTDDIIHAQFVALFGDAGSGFKYKTQKVREFTKVVSGGTPSRKHPEYWNGGTIPWVKTTELKNDILTTADEHITQAGFENSSAKLLPRGTILVALYGQGKTRGMTAMLGIEASTNQACACILPSRKVEQKYLWQYFIFSYNELRELSQGGNQKNLTGEIIKNFDVPIPPIDLQKKFVLFFDQARVCKTKLCQNIKALQKMYQKILSENLE